MTELPLVVIDVQRGGPSTGLPTKTEQADLLQAMFGRNGEAPVPVVAPQSPGDCFDAAVERSEEHTSELQSLMRISYAVFCLKKKNIQTHQNNINHLLNIVTLQ